LYIIIHSTLLKNIIFRIQHTLPSWGINFDDEMNCCRILFILEMYMCRNNPFDFMDLDEELFAYKLIFIHFDPLIYIPIHFDVLEYI
jgi:hypothetical protein